MSLDRYDDVVPTTVDDGRRGPVQALFTSYTYSPPGQFDLYTVLPGDRWDKIAMRVYGDPSQWWRIADLNPEVFDPRALRPGMMVRLPRA